MYYKRNNVLISQDVCVTFFILTDKIFVAIYVKYNNTTFMIKSFIKEDSLKEIHFVWAQITVKSCYYVQADEQKVVVLLILYNEKIKSISIKI